MDPIGVVEELHRYPVKSMVGESLSSAELTDHGLVGDRLWAVRDERGTIASAKSIPALLMCRARYLSEPVADAVGPSVPHVAILLPDGAELRSDQPDANERLSAFLGAKVTLSQKQPASDREHYRAQKMTLADMRRNFGVGPDDPLPDFSMLPIGLLAELARYATPPGTYFDAYALHVVTTSSLAALRKLSPQSEVVAARFRPNLLVRTEGEGLLEAGWCGGKLRAGDAVAAVEVPTVRCAMPMRPQPGLRSDPSVLKAVVGHAQRCFGAYAKPLQAGRIRVGDRVEVELPRTSSVGRMAAAGATSFKRLALRAVAALTPEK